MYPIRLVHLFDLSREATSMVYYRDKRLMIGADALMKPSDFFAPTRDLTIDLVAIPSVTGSSGETTIVEYLHHRLTRHKAYQSGHMRLFMIPSKDDPLFRPTLIAHLVGKKPSGVLLFGHTDTVGTSDYGALESRVPPTRTHPSRKSGRTGTGSSRTRQDGFLAIWTWIGGYEIRCGCSTHNV